MLNFRILPIQFQIVSNQKPTGSRSRVLNTSYSLLSLLSALLGLFTFHSPTPPKRLRHRGLLFPGCAGCVVLVVSGRSSRWDRAYCGQARILVPSILLVAAGATVSDSVTCSTSGTTVVSEALRSWYGIVRGVALIVYLNHLLHLHPIQFRQILLSTIPQNLKLCQ